MKLSVAWLVALSAHSTWALAADSMPAGMPAVTSDPAATPRVQEPLDLLPSTPVLDGSDEDTRKLELYGFADFGYNQPILSHSNPWRQFLPGYSTFLIGNLNVYVDTTITKKVRSLIEVRLLYSPHGSTDTINPDGSQPIQNNTIGDPAELGHSVQWGGIFIERAWIEYRPYRALAIRAGQFLTPYGIWNVDHGSPALIGIRRPYIVLDQILPERQTGIQLYGNGELPRFANLEYHLTLSNGRGPIDMYRDLDNNKALGGRVVLSTLDNAFATLGFSFYYGEYTNRNYQWGLDPATNKARRTETIKGQYNELALAWDFRLRWHAFLLNSEVVIGQNKHTAVGWTRSTAVPGYVDSDARRGGGYVTLGYRTPWWGIMPYASVEYYRPSGGGSLYPLAGVYGNPLVSYFGLNMRPIADVVFKVEFVNGVFLNADSGSWGKHALNILQAQIAWAF